MTLILNGTDSSATTPAVTGGTGGTGTGVYYPANNQVALSTNSTQALLIDASQNVGIGTASPTAKLQVSRAGGSSGSTNLVYVDVTSSYGGISVNSTANNNTFIELLEAGTKVGGLNSDTTANITSIQSAGGHVLAFNVANTTEVGRFDTSGNLLVGTTTTAFSNTNATAISIAQGYILQNHINGTVSGATYTYFAYNATQIGSITQSGTTAVLYNTTSDYRLKNDVKPIENALTTIKALNPVNFTWVDGRKDDGFIAHEIQSVIPNCVTGEKDAVQIVDDVDDEGKVIGTKEIPKYQQMDNSGVIPFLVKAIQEQQAMIEELKTKVAALEAA
jgi:hypothetical protein